MDFNAIYSGGKWDCKLKDGGLLGCYLECNNGTTPKNREGDRVSIFTLKIVLT